MNDSVDLSPAERDASAYLLGTAVPTSYRDGSPPQPTGALPVAQPGRAPQSARTTELATVMLAAGGGTALAGAGISAVLLALSTVDPVTLAVAAGAPSVFALALGGLLRTAGRAAKDAGTAVTTVTNNYAGPVSQTTNTATNTSRTVFGRAASTSKTGR
ncbi:hypothetical protein ACFQ60_15250 [Streptomyces zhihengii]|uniref:Uncharacterized protein n=1 Tax=Streptomyces zhihengii TaxID=1818004 RepID=A0ABS2UYZ8_9ACTN|nr:hypothetical protein [Streptomyces zhihengii]MBM9622233.1 hypothetical protein [Streptomyces zhihengii]